MYSNSLHQPSSTPQPRQAGGGNWTTTSRSAYTPSGHNGAYSTGSQQLGQTVQSERVLSSNIVGETLLGPMPQEENIQYVEIPVIEEVIRHVPKKEYVDVEKRIPKYEYEWVERVVEVPQIHVVDKTVEVPQIQEVIRHVPVKQVIEVPKEIIRRVPKIETKIIEREVEVPGEIIEVPKPYTVENRIVVPRYTDKEVPTVVAQRLVPIISESETDFVDVDLKEYNPYLVPVDVYVPRPVARQLIASSKTEEHRIVDLPVGQFNSLLKQLNTHVQESEIQELLIKDQRGAIPITHLSTSSMIVPPVTSHFEGHHVEGTLHYSHQAPSGPVAGTTTTTSYSTTPKYSTTTMSSRPVITSQSYSTGPTYTQTGPTYSQTGPTYSQTYTSNQGFSYTPSHYSQMPMTNAAEGSVPMPHEVVA